MIQKVKHYSNRAGRFLHHSFIPGEHNGFRPKALHRKHLVRYGVALVVVKAVMVAILIGFPSGGFLYELSSRVILDSMNTERSLYGAPVLAFNDRLYNAALEKAHDMIANSYFDHTSPAGVTPWYWIKKNNYIYTYAGENLAMDFYDVSDLMRGWMDSPTHRANILQKKFKDSAVAVAEGNMDGRNTTVVVVMFGSERVAKKTPVPITTAKETAPPSQKTVPAPAPEVAVVNAPVVLQEQLPTAGVVSVIPTSSVQAVLGAEETASVAAVSEAPPAIQEEADAVSSISADSLYQFGKKMFVEILFNVGIKMPQYVQSLFLYFGVFLAAAVLLNILIHLRIQHWETIAGAVLLIATSVGFAFI